MNRTAVITGATSGIGHEFARLLAADGFDLVVVGRNAARLDAARHEFETEYGITVMPIEADLSKDGEADRVYAAVNAAGLDAEILINNAGVGDYGRFVDIPWEKERSIAGLNMISVMRLMQLFAADMERRGGGKILNLSSIAAYMPGPYMPMYYASKSFVYSLSQAVAKEMEGTGVTVTCLCPGPTATNFEKEANMGKANRMFTFFRPMTAADVALEGYRAMQRGEVVHTTRPYYKILKLACRLAPERWKRDLTKKINAGK